MIEFGFGSQSIVGLILINATYILILIDPIANVAVTAMLSSEEKQERFQQFVAKSTLAAGVILIGAMLGGEFILRRLFQVEIYSLQIAGGFVLFLVGLESLREGIFVRETHHAKIEELAIVPIACPMIAGPATITACITLRLQQGLWKPFIGLIIALVVNYFILRSARFLVRLLSQFNLMGALIRITGLIIMAVGVQMALNGFWAWLGRP